MTTCDPADGATTPVPVVIENVPVTLDSATYEIHIDLPDDTFDPSTDDAKATIKVVIPNYPSPVNARPIQYNTN